jgi:REP element-mobilizing transposase RayT
MPNHFHFLVKIKNEKDLLLHLNSSRPTTLEKQISKQFSNFFSSYTQAFNKQQSRMGSLFMKNFKRKRIADEKYLRKLVHYIHHNPVEANLCRKPNGWKFSSYNSLLSEQPTFLLNNEVIGWFEDKENFIYCHHSSPKETGITF